MIRQEPREPFRRAAAQGPGPGAKPLAMIGAQRWEAPMTTVSMSYWPADTSVPVEETTVGGILRAAAAAGPQLPAMVGGVPDPAARKRWTFEELLADAEQAARALTARF